MTGVDDRCAASPRLAALSWIVQAKPLTRLHGHTGDAGLEVCLCPQNNRFIRHDQGMRKSLWDKQDRFIRVARDARNNPNTARAACQASPATLSFGPSIALLRALTCSDRTASPQISASHNAYASPPGTTARLSRSFRTGSRPSIRCALPGRRWEHPS